MLTYVGKEFGLVHVIKEVKVIVALRKGFAGLYTFQSHHVLKGPVVGIRLEVPNATLSSPWPRHFFFSFYERKAPGPQRPGGIQAVGKSKDV